MLDSNKRSKDYFDQNEPWDQYPRTPTRHSGQLPGGPDRDALREEIRQAIIGKAVDLVSGPGGLASYLRHRQLGARLAGPSVPLDIGQP